MSKDYWAGVPDHWAEDAKEARRSEFVRIVLPRCPHCGAKKPRTYGVRGDVRYHYCVKCGRKFKSREAEDGVG